jgi:hypothetical protein
VAAAAPTSAGEEATAGAGMKRKDPLPPPPHDMINSASLTTSSPSKLLRITLNNVLPTPKNLSNLLPEMDKAPSEEQDATTISPCSPPIDVVPPPTLIDYKSPTTSRGNSSPCWSFFKLFDPSRHPDLEQYAQCTLCDTKISHGKDHSTSGMNKHLMFKHVDVYKKMLQDTKAVPATNKITTHFTVKDRKCDSDMKQLFTVAAATCVATNGLSLDLFTRPSFRNMFGAISRTANCVVNIGHACLCKELLTLGLIAEEAIHAEIKGKHVSYTSDH